MNKLEPSPTCRICGFNLRGNWNIATLVRMRIEWNRMMSNGMCDNCQHDRLNAAIEYEAAVGDVRLVTSMGARWSSHRPPRLHPALLRASHRLSRAVTRCEELMMWPADRPVREEHHQ